MAIDIYTQVLPTKYKNVLCQYANKFITEKKILD